VARVFTLKCALITYPLQQLFNEQRSTNFQDVFGLGWNIYFYRRHGIDLETYRVSPLSVAVFFCSGGSPARPFHITVN